MKESIRKSLFLKLAPTVFGCFSILTLVLMKVEQSPSYLILIATVSYGAWYGLFMMLSSSSMKRALRCEVATKAAGSEVQNTFSDEVRYYDRLLNSLTHNWDLFGNDFSNSSATLKNANHFISNALDHAKNTGVLAANAMVAAANTGEVGRGFVTVSKDLIAISDQSNKDLGELKLILTQTGAYLNLYNHLLIDSIQGYVVRPEAFPFDEFEQLHFRLKNTQTNLREIALRYQKNAKQDVRWIQISDAVKRLFNELINALYQLELRLSDVLNDMRLLRLTGSITEQQFTEFEGRINGMGVDSPESEDFVS